ncbi:MAG: hypothetical protein ABIV39_12670 [Verrucomicrobiota bacterium]
MNLYAAGKIAIPCAPLTKVAPDAHEVAIPTLKVCPADDRPFAKEIAILNQSPVIFIVSSGPGALRIKLPFQ